MIFENNIISILRLFINRSNNIYLYVFIYDHNDNAECRSYLNCISAFFNYFYKLRNGICCTYLGGDLLINDYKELKHLDYNIWWLYNILLLVFK